jgi:hypothetical protein
MPHRRNTIEPQDDESANIINDQVRRSSTLSEGNNHSDIPLIQRDAIVIYYFSICFFFLMLYFSKK